jgi:hypothetical protein
MGEKNATTESLFEGNLDFIFATINEADGDDVDCRRDGGVRFEFR